MSDRYAVRYPGDVSEDDFLVISFEPWKDTYRVIEIYK